MTNLCLERLAYETSVPSSILIIHASGSNVAYYNGLLPPLITLANIRHIVLPRVKFNRLVYLNYLVYTKHRRVIRLGNRVTKAYIWSNDIQCINHNTYTRNSKQSKSIINQRILYLSLCDNDVFSVPKLCFRYLNIECNYGIRQPVNQESILTLAMPVQCLYRNTYLGKSVRQIGSNDIGHLSHRLNARIYNLHGALRALSKSTRKYGRLVPNVSQWYSI